MELEKRYRELTDLLVNLIEEIIILHAVITQNYLFHDCNFLSYI